MTQLSADAVVAEAVAMAGVAEPDTETFRSNLDLLTDSINAEAGLRPEAIGPAQTQLAHVLRNRIEVSDWLRRRPQIADEPIEKPLFLTGLPRSGTTYFQYLFDAEPSMRMLRFWEGQRPCPPPAVDPASARNRIEACAQDVLKARNDPLHAKIAEIHLTDVEGPEECLPLLEQTFANVGHYWTYRIPSYFARCLDTVDLLACYAHHKRVLQLLQWKSDPKRWVLKWPCHLVALPQLLDVYRDASFVMTHRDPVQALASNCSLTALLRRSSAGSVDLHEIGQQMKAMVLVYLQRLVDFDQRYGGRIAHVDYQTAVDQPQVAVAAAFERLGIEMTDRFAQSIIAWRQDNPPGKRGSHVYALEDYGLDAEAVAAEYAFYIRRFDVPAEGAGK
jgi:hypothetical protein